MDGVGRTESHPRQPICCSISLLFVRTVVLELSATVLVLERIVTADPTFDHERLDVYRLSIAYVAFSYRIARSLSSVNRPARDQRLRAA